MQTSLGSGTIVPGWLPRRPWSALARGQMALLLTLVVLTTGAWAVTISQARTMTMPMGVVSPAAMPGVDPAHASHHLPGVGFGEATAVVSAGMGAAGWTAAGLLAFVVSWAVMMAAMMFPTAAPMLLLFHAVARQRRAAGTRSGFVPTGVFATGYLVVWTAVGAVVWALLQAVSAGVGRLEAAERAAWAPLALGVVLVGAGLYQLTPFKQGCLDQCRSPFVFVMQHWRPGHRGTLRMGVIHGLYCLGCCLALTAVLVAVGVMSVPWMLVLTLAAFAEKVLPLGRRTAHVVGAAFVVLGVAVAIGAATVPGLL